MSVVSSTYTKGPHKYYIYCSGSMGPAIKREVQRGSAEVFEDHRGRQSEGWSLQKRVECIFPPLSFFILFISFPFPFLSPLVRSGLGTPWAGVGISFLLYCHKSWTWGVITE